MLQTGTIHPTTAVPLAGVGDVTPSATVPEPLEKAQAKQQERETGARLAKWIVGLLLGLAFVLASFPARNSDLWRHLAAGRQMANWKYDFGKDPFASTTTGITWVNHAWLWDFFSYSFFQLAGGTGLLLVKGLLVALLVALLLSLSRYAADPSIAALSVGLGLLTISAWLPLQPVLVSYVFLALTLWLLERIWQQPTPSPQANQEAGPLPVFKKYIPLLVLFVFWANLDEWFILGPVILILYVTAQTLQWLLATPPDRRAEAGSSVVTTNLVAFAGFAVCLLNPHYWHVYQLPGGLLTDGLGDTLGSDALLALPFASPFRMESFLHAWDHRSVAILAYYPLVAVSLLSFILNWAELRLSHFVVWCLLFLLSAYRMQAIPFFAIAAGPLMGFNLQCYLARQARLSGNSESSKRLRGLALVVVLLVLLLGAAWPGWLQGRPFEARAWNVDQDQSLERAAWRLDDLRMELARPQRLGPDYGVLNVTPELGNSLAWFGSGEKCFVDDRSNLFPSATRADFLSIRQGLLSLVPGAPRPPAEATAWRDILRQWKVRLIVVTENDLVRKGSLVTALLDKEKEWALLFLEGRTAIFGWRDPRDGDQVDLYRGVRLDLVRRGLHPPAAKKAPANWSGHWPRSATPTDLFIRGTPDRSVDREEAIGHWLQFEELRSRAKLRLPAQVDSLLIAGVFFRCGSMSEGWLALADTRLPLSAFQLNQQADSDLKTDVGTWSNYYRNRLAIQLNEGPPHLLFLVIRAARRAIHANPNDYQAWQLLGRAYMALSLNTWERFTGERYARLAQVRQAQAAAAFEQALQIKPDYAQAHGGLYLLFQNKQVGYDDLALYHLQKFARLSNLAGPEPGEKAEDFEKRLGRLTAEIAERKSDIDQRLADFDREHAASIQARFQVAINLGLIGKARDLLLNSDVGAFGQKGMMNELRVLLQTGFVREARTFIKGKQRASMSPQDYKWLQAEIAAVLGDYDRLDAELADLSPDFKQPDWTGRPSTDLRAEAARGIAELLMRETGFRLQPSLEIPEMPLDELGLPSRASISGRLLKVVQRLVAEAEMATLRGVFALEQGETERAEVLFRQALSIWVNEERARSGASRDYENRPLAQYYLDLIETTKYTRR
jgi:hypothetical protein